MPAAEVSFNPLAPDMCIDPYPHYARMREHGPVHLSDLDFWLLFRHADVAAFFAEKRLEHQYFLTQTMRSGPEVVDQPYFDLFHRMVFILDNPDHRRVRRMFTSSFTPMRVRSIRGQVEAIAGALLDDVEPQGGMDLVTDFAKPFPTRVIGALLGVPEPDQIRIGSLADALAPALEFLPMDIPTLLAANEASLELAAYFRQLAVAKRAAPDDSLYSAMVRSVDEGGGDDGLDEEELIANAVLMYIAGHETTTGAVGLAVLGLHRNPDQLALLREQPALLPNAVEELLRYDTPGQATARVTMEAIEFGDTTIEAGNGVVAYIGSANRDDAAYPDAGRLDLRRPVEGLTSFGGGAHLCIGHALARQELEVALRAILQRFPSLTLDTLDPPFRPTALMRGVASLPVTW
jgi:cytochrome P450